MLFESANHITLFGNDNITLGTYAILVAKFENTNSRGEKKDVFAVANFLNLSLSVVAYTRWSHRRGILLKTNN